MTRAGDDPINGAEGNSTDDYGATDEPADDGGGENPGSLRLDATPFDPVAFLEAAVATPSQADVSEMRELLVSTLERFGVDVTVDDAGCVIAESTSPSPASGPHLVLNTHIDTVTPHVPFERDSEAGVIRGRGACDAKGPLAALLYGFLAVEPATGQLTLAVTPDEEALSLGAAALTGRLPGTTDRLGGDCYLVGEPTGLDACTAAKGRFQGRVELAGTAAHAAEFGGANAVAAAEGALAAIRTFDDDADDHPQLGSPKLTPTVIEGGSATNQVPADCTITVDRRSVPPESADGFRAALAETVRASIDDDVGVTVRLTDRESPFLEAFATDPSHPFVETVAGAARDAGVAASLPTGRGGEVRPFGAATEASYFAPRPTVVFGPGDLADDEGAVAHAEREYVRVREVEVAAAAVADTIRSVLDHP